MLNSKKLFKVAKQKGVSIQALAEHLASGGMDRTEALSVLKKWKDGLYNPVPKKEEIERLAGVLGVEASAISEWKSSYRYAPMSPSKVRLVTALIANRDVQDALDILKFTRKRAAEALYKVLKAAIANADEQEADVENLYVSGVRADGAGRRVGTKGWRAKDRGRAHPICKQASHIHVTVTEH